MKTVVIGASTNPERYSYKAVGRLLEHGHEVVPVGVRGGTIHGVEIQTETPEITGVHTVTLYINKDRQPAMYDYIFSLRPQRIIFNPGTENDALKSRAKQQNIEVVEGCTLVMLASGTF